MDDGPDRFEVGEGAVPFHAPDRELCRSAHMRQHLEEDVGVLASA